MPILPSVAPPRFTFSGGTPAFHPAPSPKTAWQHAVAQADLPFHTKGILLIVATEWMNADGGSCFPTEAQIMERTGVSRPCLTKHMRIAVEGGFIERWRWGHGNGNRRYNYRAIVPGQPAPTVEMGNATAYPIPEMGNVVSYPTGEMGNEVSDHEPLPIVNHSKKREGDPEPVAAPLPPTGAPSKFIIQTKNTLPEDWQLPEDYRSWAAQQRPDLADRLDAIAFNFHNFHLSRATRSASWIAEWKRWIVRERAVKPHQTASTATQPTNRYPRPDAKEQPVSAAVKAAMNQIEERRLSRLAAMGIDPLTGLKAAPPATPEPAAPAAPPIMGQGPDASYAARFERHMRLSEERAAQRRAEQERGDGLT